MTEDCSIVLARTRFGEIKRCVPGCTHLTFAGVTLHFDTFEEFLHFGELAEQRREGSLDTATFEICYRWVSVNVCANSFESLLGLLKKAIDEAAWRDGDYSTAELTLGDLSG